MATGTLCQTPSPAHSSEERPVLSRANSGCAIIERAAKIWKTALRAERSRKSLHLLNHSHNDTVASRDSMITALSTSHSRAALFQSATDNAFLFRILIELYP